MIINALLRERPIKEPQGAINSIQNIFDGVDSTAMEDVTGLGDIPVPKRSTSSGMSGPTSSPKLLNQFPTPSLNSDPKWSVVISIPEDARVLSAHVWLANYLRILVTEED